MTHNQRRYYSV